MWFITIYSAIRNMDNLATIAPLTLGIYYLLQNHLTWAQERPWAVIVLALASLANHVFGIYNFLSYLNHCF